MEGLLHLYRALAMLCIVRFNWRQSLVTSWQYSAARPFNSRFTPFSTHHPPPSFSPSRPLSYRDPNVKQLGQITAYTDTNKSCHRSRKLAHRNAKFLSRFDDCWSCLSNWLWLVTWPYAISFEHACPRQDGCARILR